MTLKEALLLCPTWSVSALGPSFSLWIALSINTPGCMQSVQFMSSGELMVSWVPKTGSAPNLLNLSSEAQQPLCRPLELVPCGCGRMTPLCTVPACPFSEPLPMLVCQHPLTETAQGRSRGSLATRVDRGAGEASPGGLSPCPQ